MGEFDFGKISPSISAKGDPKKTIEQSLKNQNPFEFFPKPKTPKPTAQELEVERRQRKELDELTRESNSRLKAIKRGQVGRRTLLGSNTTRSTQDGIGGVGVRNRGAGAAARFGGGTSPGGGIRPGLFSRNRGR